MTEIFATTEPRAGISSSRTLMTWLSDRFGKTARKGVLALIDQAVVSGASFLATVIIGRLCGAEELGIYSLAFALLVLVAAVHESLIWTPYTVFSNRLEGIDRAEYAGCAFIMQGMLTALGLTALGVTAVVLSMSSGWSKISPLLWILMGTTPCFLLREFVRRVELARLHVAKALLLDVAVSTIFITGVLFVFFKGVLSAESACVILAVACGVPSLAWLGLSLTRSELIVRWKSVPCELRRYWAFSRWICAGQLTDVAQTYSVHWLLAVAVGTAATGIYAACLSVVLIFNPLILGIGSVLVPRAARALKEGGQAEVRRVVWKTTALLGCAVAVLCLLVIVFGDEALRLMYDGEEYGGHGLIVVVLAVSTVIGSLSFASDNGLWVIERPDVNFKAGLLGLAVTLIVSLALVGSLGILGAAIGSCAGLTVASAVQCFAFAYLTRQSVCLGGRP